MSGLVEVTGPAVEPISRNEAREHLRLDDDVDDSQVRAYITASRIWAENYTGRKFISRTFNQYFDTTSGDLPLKEGFHLGFTGPTQNDYLELSACPAISVSAIHSYDDDDNETLWASSNYYVSTASPVARIVLRDGGTFPTDLRNADGLKVTYTAGYGTQPNAVPEAIRLAILQYMAFAYEHRGDYEGSMPTPPSIISTLLQPYRITRFG